MLKTTDAPKNKNVENTCVYNISVRTKQNVIYASSILLFYQSYFTMRYLLLHVTSESKMNSNNHDIIYMYCRLFQNQNSKQLCFFPPVNSSLHLASKRRSLVSHGKHTQFLCPFSSKPPILSTNSMRVWRQYTAFITLLNVPLFSETEPRLLREGQKGVWVINLRSCRMRHYVPSKRQDVSLFRHGAMSINLKLT